MYNNDKDEKSDKRLRLLSDLNINSGSRNTCNSLLNTDEPCVLLFQNLFQEIFQKFISVRDAEIYGR